MKILLIGSQHGNEPLGDMLYEYLNKQYPHLLPNIIFIIGNPRAHRAKVRYIESDLNRSYDGMLHTYEAERARYIIKFIQDGDFDLVLDLHTTVCDQPPCFILPSLNDAVISFIRASHIERVVLLNDPIVYSSLTGVSPKTIAIEIANSELNNSLMNKLCQDIEHYIKGDIKSAAKKVYDTPSLLFKTEIAEELVDSLVNFQKSDQGFIPILVGQNSYRKTTPYLGFKATVETDITL